VFRFSELASVFVGLKLKTSLLLPVVASLPVFIQLLILTAQHIPFVILA
jgi:hypothetical protein